MSDDPVIYRYWVQRPVGPASWGDRLPCFEGALRFVYERGELGEPTLAKLATAAVSRLVDPDLGHLQAEWLHGQRVWIWTDDGEFVGSIVMRLRIALRWEAVGDDSERGEAA